ncbi:MAG: 1,4-alpha-glucan branching protein domain-containing protein [Treponema sp.]
MKKIVFILEENTLFVSPTSDEKSVAENRFFDMITYRLIPFLKMCDNLIKDGIPFKLGLSISPIYCQMLKNKILTSRYKTFLENKIAFEKQEEKRLENNETLISILHQNIELIKQTLQYFLSIKEDIVSRLSYLQKKDYIEVLAAAVSSAFLPVYKRVPEVVHAQLQMGRLLYADYFDAKKLKGFFPQFLGFFKGLDKILKSYGYEYSLVSSGAFLLSKKIPKTGVFAPAVTEGGLKLLSTDISTYNDLIFALNSYEKNEAYLTNYSDIGFSLQDREYLLPLFDLNEGRRITGFRYFTHGKEPYNYQKAMEQAKKDAISFVSAKRELLGKVETRTQVKDPLSLTVFTSNFLGFRWYEGFIWLEEVFRAIHEIDDMEMSFPYEVATSFENPDKVELFYSSLLDSSYAEELFTEENDWMYRYIMKCTERLKNLINMFGNMTPLNIRTLNLATREVTMMQNSYWAFFANNKCYRDHSIKHFKEMVKSFTYIYEMLGSTKDEIKYLTTREQELNILESIDYRFYKKMD